MIFRNNLVNAVLNNKDLQRTFNFSGSGNLEAIQYEGERHICKNIQEWAKLSRCDGAWGDQSVIQIFADITGLVVHVVPTEFLSVTTMTHYCPMEDYLDEASIAIVHGQAHFQILATTDLPSSISVTVKDTPEAAPSIDLAEENEVDGTKLPREKWPKFKRKSQKVRKKNLIDDSNDSEDDLELSARNLDEEDEVDGTKLPRKKWPKFKRKFQKVKKGNLIDDINGSEDDLALSARKKGRFEKENWCGSTKQREDLLMDEEEKEIHEVDDARPIISPLNPAASLHQSEGCTVPGPSSQGGLGEEGVSVGTTAPSGPSPLRGSGVPVKKVYDIDAMEDTTSIASDEGEDLKNSEMFSDDEKDSFKDNQELSPVMSSPSDNGKDKPDESNFDVQDASRTNFPGDNREDVSPHPPVTDSPKKTSSLREDLLKDDEKKKTIRTGNKQTGRCKSEWFEKIDENGNLVGSYLRPVEGKPDVVYCCVDSTEFKVGSRGWGAVKDHWKSQKHLAGLTARESNKTIGSFFVKNSANPERTSQALMKLVLFSVCHGVGFVNIDHLVKTCAEAFPDSSIAKDLSMGRTSASYHLKFGLAKTEADKVFSDISSVPFSLSLDTGIKGKKKRTEVIVRYYCDDEGFQRVVEKLLFIIKSSHETSSHLAESLFARFESEQVDLANLVSVNTDSCSVMRGKKSGLIKRLSKEAPSVLKSDVGGDGLHHVHNAEKKAFMNGGFLNVIKLLDNVKYDICTSPGKLEDYLECCKIAGDNPVIPTSWCSSRFLDRYEAIQDRIDHIDTLIEYYSRAKTPRKKQNAPGTSTTKHKLNDADEFMNFTQGESKYQKTEDSVPRPDQENFMDEDDDENVDLRGNPAGRVEFMKRILSAEHIVDTELKLVVGLRCLKAGYDFLRIFQGKEVKIHLLYQTYLDLLKEVLVEVCQPSSLKNSRGEDLSGKELKFLKIETIEERNIRRMEESKTVKDEKEKKGEHVRYGLLMKEKDFLLSKELRQDLDLLCSRYSLGSQKKEELLKQMKNLQYMFLVELSKALQHYLPLDNDFLRWLKYLCPKKFLESEETEAYLVKIALCTPSVIEDDVDDLRREVRILKAFKNDKFNDNLDFYLANVSSGYKKIQRSKEVASIDKVWTPILLSDEFPILNIVLRSSLSIFHSTASVEGAVNITRNILGDRSHSLTEPNIEAKKIVKSAVKEAPSVCCYDYKVTQDHHHDWIKARQSLINNNVELGSDESDGDEIDLDKKAGLFKQKDTGSDLIGGKKNVRVLKKKNDIVAKRNGSVENEKNNKTGSFGTAKRSKETAGKDRKAVEKKKKIVEKKKEIVDKKKETVTKKKIVVDKCKEGVGNKKVTVQKKSDCNQPKISLFCKLK